MITVVYCTKETKPSHTEHIIRSSGLGKNIEVIEIINHGEGLTAPYNRGLAQASNDIVVFMHDDVMFDSDNWGKKLLSHFNNSDYGILGLAGTTDVPETGRWWDDRAKMVGIVNHKHEGKKWESKYSTSWGNDITRVVMVDGLFFAVHKQRIKNKFNEDVKGFHFYELDFMVRNYQQDVKIGVIYNIRVTHLSIGMTNQEWENNRIQFTQNFKLPITYVPDYPQVESVKGMGKVQIKVVIQTTNNIENVKNLYDKIMSFEYPKLSINLISTDTNFEELNGLNLPKVKVFEGYYNELPKNLGIMKFDENFFENDDELVVFLSEETELLNNIFYNFAKKYSDDKNSFGGIFPLAYNTNKTIFCNRLEMFVDKERKVAINMKDGGSYYNYQYGVISHPMGNLADCFATTPSLLKQLDWFRMNYSTPIFYNEFALKAYLKGKTIYNDTNSLTIQKSYKGETNIAQDFQSFVNYIGTEKKLQELVKELG